MTNNKCHIFFSLSNIIFYRPKIVISLVYTKYVVDDDNGDSGV